MGKECRQNFLKKRKGWNKELSIQTSNDEVVIYLMIKLVLAKTKLQNFNKIE